MAAIPYFKVFDVPYYFDDFQCIQQNPFIRDISNYFSKDTVAATLTAHPSILEDTRNSFITRPLPYVTFTLEYYLHGLQNLSLSHAINLLIHLINTLLVFLIIRHILPNIDDCADNRNTPSTLASNADIIPFLTAALFAVHPLMTSAVTYLIQRMTSLMTLFYLATILFYLYSRDGEARRRLYYLLALFTSVCAMLTKEAAVTIPFFLLMYELLFRSFKIGTVFTRLAPFLLASIIPVYHVTGLHNSLTKGGNLLTTSANLINFNNYGYFEFLLTQCKVILFYWRLLFWPSGLALEHEITLEQSLSNPLIFCALLIHLTLLTFCAIYIFRAARGGIAKIGPGKAYAFGIGWFYLTISIEAGAIPLNDLAVEYRLYLPSVGFFLCSVVMIQRLFIWVIQRKSAEVTTGSSTALVKLNGIFWATALIALATVTFTRNQLWRDPENFWKDNIAHYPTIKRAYANLADHYIRSGKPSEAILVYKDAITKIPNDSLLHYELGITHMLANDYNQAITELKRSIIINPGNEASYVALAKAYALSGSVDTAINVLNSLENRRSLP